MTHLGRQDLERWWREGQPADRARMVDHLARCDECGALYGEVIDASHMEVDERAVLRVDLVSAAYRVDRRQRRTVLAFWPPRALAAGVAAAAVIAIVVGTSMLRSPAPPEDPYPEGIRSGSLQPLVPIGAVDPPVRFRWASPVNAARYLVEVRDEERRLLFVLSSDVESVNLPAERADALIPGRQYWWEIVGLDASGDTIMRGPSRTFTVSARRP
jgi:hypothetical protein